MPKSSVEKRIPHSSPDEQLNFQEALINEKIETKSVVKKLVLVANQNIENTRQIKETNHELNVTNKKLNEDTRKYTPEFKQCIYELLLNNVSASKIPIVEKAVFKLVNTVPNKIPSKSTILEMNLQRLYLSQTQLSEVFSQKENTILMTDETSKFGSKFLGYEAADSDGRLWVLGLRDIETKSANSTLNVFREILND